MDGFCIANGKDIIRFSSHQKIATTMAPSALLLLAAALIFDPVKREFVEGPRPSPSPPPPAPIVYDVCTSPGCRADGSPATLAMLEALAPPRVHVRSGPCRSLCGNGPVVVENDQKRHRKVKGDRILSLLVEHGLDNGLVRGYQCACDADAAFDKKDYRTAMEGYQQAVDIAFRPAMELQAARQTSQPSALDWLVRARCREAQAALALGDVEAALLAAQAAGNLSRNTSTKALEVLADIYHAKQDAPAERHTLERYFSMTKGHDESRLDFKEAAVRRELGFRLARLQRDAPH